MKATPSMFRFSQDEEKKWHSEINPEFLVHFQTTEGVPMETTLRWINNLSFTEKIILKTKEWKAFAKEKGIDTSPFRKESMEHKTEIIKHVTLQIT